MAQVAAVRAALAALAACPPWQRRAKVAALLAAGAGLAELVDRYRAWLDREDCALADVEEVGMGVADSAYEARLARYTERLQVYEEASKALTRALAAAKEDGR